MDRTTDCRFIFAVCGRCCDNCGTQYEDVRMTLSLSVNSTPSVLVAWLRSAHARPITAAALTAAIVGTATILGALFFEHVLDLAPCHLCLKQRSPYYIAIPLAF